MAEIARPQFDLDLAFGEARETAFVKAVAAATVECKSDQKLRSTGNLFVEIRQGNPKKGYGRKSGIQASLAKWWAVEYDDDCWLVVRTPLLYQLTLRAYKERGSVMGGDNHNEGVLVPVEWLITPWRKAA